MEGKRIWSRGQKICQERDNNEQRSRGDWSGGKKMKAWRVGK